MKDRGNAAYETIERKADTKRGWIHPMSLRVSPTRQAKKARGLSGRQEVRWRKEQRRGA